MARTTAEDVGGIIKLKAGLDIQPYIDSASQLIDAVCLSSGYTYRQLELIERWLAAHFYDVNYPRTFHSAIAGGPSLEVERVKVDLGLNVTKYGQQAMRLDWKGNLAALEVRMQNGKGAADTKWLGTAYCR